MGTDAAAEWNTRHPVGTPVWYHPVRGEAAHELAETRSPAWLLGHGQAVVSITGRSGGIPLGRLVPLCSESELRERIAHEIETDQPPAELLECDHDDQLDALTAWHAFAARGYCTSCDGRGHEDPDEPDDTCEFCAGYGTWGGASDGS